MLLLNGKQVPYFKFSDGCLQPNVKELVTRDKTQLIEWLPTNSDDIVLLLLVVNAVINFIPRVYRFDLTILYLPYARQDRVCAKGESCGRDGILHMIRNLNLSSVTILDPHSNIPNWFNGLKISMIELFQKSKVIVGPDILFCAPDKNAYEKCLIQGVKEGKLIHADKIRNTSNGKIEGMELIGECIGKTVIVLDDICDGGKTFEEVGKLLLAKGAKELHLHVTHGIFSKGLSELLKYYKTINCYHVLNKAYEYLDEPYFNVTKRYYA